jgi:hypothetical protein
MKSGKPVSLPESSCLNCGKVLDGATVVDEENAVRPVPGSISVCIHCGHVMAFDEKMQFRELTDDEIVEIAGDERLVAISRAMAAMRKKQ